MFFYLQPEWQNKKVAGFQTTGIILMIALTPVQTGVQVVAGLPVEVLRQVHRVEAHLPAAVMVAAVVAAAAPVAVGKLEIPNQCDTF